MHTHMDAIKSSIEWEINRQTKSFSNTDTLKLERLWQEAHIYAYCSWKFKNVKLVSSLYTSAYFYSVFPGLYEYFYFI